MNAGIRGAGILLLAASAAPASAAPECLYEVESSSELVLDVRVTCDPEVRGLAHLDVRSAGHVTVLESERTGARFSARYRANLGALARERATLDAALSSGRSVLAVASSWLLRPECDPPAALDVRMSVPPGIDFVTAQPLVDGVFRIPPGELSRAGFAAFGRLRRHPMTAGSPDDPAGTSGYEIVFLDGPLDLPDEALVEWIARAGEIMTRFWHGFPAPGMKIFVQSRPGADGVPFGRDMSGGGISMVLVVGEHATRAQLADDWVLIHELVHVGSPFVPGAPWFTEGLATYLEPLLRARHGLQTPAAMWTEFYRNMPRGAAVIGSTGLVRGGFRGWYWGGGLVMLLADVEIRRASAGRLGLEDCLRAVRARVGNYLLALGLDDMVGACDAAIGGDTLARLVERHARAATPVDLDRLWRDLGVHLVDGTLVLDDAAPLAAVREAVVRGGPAGAGS